MPFKAGKADNLAPAETERRAVADKVAADARHLVLGARLALNLVVDHRGAAAHQLDQPSDRGARRRALPGDAAIAKHEDPGGDVHDFVQLVADEDEGEAGAGALAHIVAQLPGALEVERRRGLVEHDQAHTRGCGRARDFDHLPLADRQAIDARIGIDFISRKDRVQRGPSRPAVEIAPAGFRARALRVFDEEVFRDRQCRAQRQFLVDHSDAAPLRRVGVVVREGYLDAVKRDPSQRRRGDSAQDPHERRLAGAVAADQADHVGGRPPQNRYPPRRA